MRIFIFPLLLTIACDGEPKPSDVDTTPDDSPPTLPTGDIACGVSWFWVTETAAEQWTEPMMIAAEADGEGYALTIPTRQGPASTCRVPIAWADGAWTDSDTVSCSTPCSGTGDVSLDLVTGTSSEDTLALTAHFSEGTCTARANIVCDARLEPGEDEEPLPDPVWTGAWSCLTDWHRSEGTAEAGYFAQPEDASTDDASGRVLDFGGCSIALDEARVSTMTTTPACSSVLSESGARVSDAAVTVVGDSLMAHVQYTLEEGGVGYALGSYALTCTR